MPPNVRLERGFDQTRNVERRLNRLGLDFAIADNRWIRVDARYIDIDTDVKVNGGDVGTVNIDPMVYGAAFVWRF